MLSSVKAIAIATSILLIMPATQAAASQDSLAKNAFLSVKKYMDNSFIISEDAIVFGDGITNKNKKLFKQRLSQAISIWDEDYGVIPNYKAYIFSIDDLSWADSQAGSNGDQVPFGSWSSWITLKNKGPDCGPGFAKPTRFYLCTSKNPSKGFHASIIAHEYFHSIQDKIGLRHDNIPVWIFEGSAIYFGSVSSKQGMLAMKEQARYSSGSYFSNKFGSSGLENHLKQMSPEDISIAFGRLEIGPTLDSISVVEEYNGYFLGGLAVEYLIGQHGYPKFMKFLKNVGSGIPWQQEFYNSFKTNKEKFYNDFFKYLKTIY